MEDMFNLSTRVRLRTNLAVLLLDDLTGQPIIGSNARVWIEGQKPPVKKNDGWNAFLELPPGTYTVSGEGGTYARRNVQVNVGASMETLLLRLGPNCLYRSPSDCVRIEGHAEPGAEITAYAEGKQTEFKLLRDCAKKDTSLAIFHSGSAVLQGRLLRMTAPDGKSETVLIEGASEGKQGEYRISAPVDNAYPRIGTILVPVAETQSDADGSFFVLVKAGSGDASIIVEASGRRKTKKDLERGEGNTITADLR